LGKFYPLRIVNVADYSADENGVVGIEYFEIPAKPDRNTSRITTETMIITIPTIELTHLRR